jgi:asparagine synthetase B (glutamine-hydrolysing)
VAEFRGRFAFALWSAKHHRLLIARDPMGIAALLLENDQYSFASSGAAAAGLIPAIRSTRAPLALLRRISSRTS